MVKEGLGSGPCRRLVGEAGRAAAPENRLTRSREGREGSAGGGLRVAESPRDRGSRHIIDTWLARAWHRSLARYSFANGNWSDLRISFEGRSESVTVIGYFSASGPPTLDKRRLAAPPRRCVNYWDQQKTLSPPKGMRHLRFRRLDGELVGIVGEL
jgi:hypothetical protein